jgi:filamentous hemagglutinin family protein
LGAIHIGWQLAIGGEMISYIKYLIAVPMCVYAYVSAHAGITTDGSVGAMQKLSGPNYIIGANLGKAAGVNLFQSFGQFSLQKGESATFSGPANIVNVISRVTGGFISSIGGPVSVAIPGANLYFINPAGIVFNSGASLNVPGSVVLSTANGLRFSDGSMFDANIGQTTFSPAAPSALVFGGQSAAISVLGADLATNRGQTLALIGGNLHLSSDPTVQGSNASLHAPSGKVLLLSMGGGSTFSIDLPNFAAATGTTGGSLTVAPGSRISASENSGDRTGAGNIQIFANQLTISGAELRSETVNGNSGGVSIQASSVSLENTAINTATIGGTGNAGKIDIRANSIEIRNGTQIDTSSDPLDRNNPTPGSGGSGNGGDVTLTATTRLSVVGCTSCQIPTGVATSAYGSGHAGNIAITSGGDVSLVNYSVVQSDNYGPNSSPGVIAVDAVNLNLVNGAQLSTGAHASGAGGNIILNLKDALTVTGQGIDMSGATVPAGVFANTFASAPGGHVKVAASTVNVYSGGEISSSSRDEQLGLPASGKAGSITIDASDSVSVSGQTHSAGVYVNALSLGDAGDLLIRSPLLAVSEGARIQSQNMLSGKGGSINLNVQHLQMSSGGGISVETQSSKAGGNIQVTNADDVSLVGNGSGFFATTSGSVGRGGSIYISAGTLSMREKAAISVDTYGLGDGGDISILARNALTLGGQSKISSSSSAFGGGSAGAITLDAGSVLKMVDSSLKASTADAQGGNIVIKALDLIYLQNSQITTEAKVGVGSGGNISIDPVLMVMNHSQIVANAFGGNGGNIAIDTNTFLKSPDSAVSASSQLGINGTIQISSPALDMSAQIVSLPNLGATLKLNNSPCAHIRRKGNGFGIARASGWTIRGEMPLAGSFGFNPNLEVGLMPDEAANRLARLKSVNTCPIF